MQLTAEENLSLPQIFCQRASQYHTRTAFLSKNNPRKEYEPVTWHEWADHSKSCALGLFSLGVRRHDRVAVLSENRPEWPYVDMGTLSLGGILVPIYPTSSAQDIVYILQDAEVEVLIVSTAEQLERIWSFVSVLKLIRWVICMEPFSRKDPRLISFSDLLKKGEMQTNLERDFYEKNVASGDPDDTATIIYTSGTTGFPKGVMLTHRNFAANYAGAQTLISVTEKDTALSFLPLSHVFERLAGYYFMAFHGAVIAYAENMQTVPENMLEIRPTVCAAVPRFYEKIHAKILENVEKGSAAKKRIFEWAVRIGRKRSQLLFLKRRLPAVLSLQYLFAKFFVFSQIKKKMGGRLRFFISGGAPLSKELAEFFFAADILILEGYGLTETSPVITVNSQNDFRFGTVGKPLPNVDVKIAEDGEIITRGPCVMKGYFRNPEATAEVIKDGWFHTGDIGQFEDGYLRITDRKKDIIATSGGKKVSPQNIERQIVSDPLFLQAVLVGDQRNYLVALIVPSRPLVESYARDNSIEGDYISFLSNPKIFSWIDERLRARTAGLAPYEQIKYFALIEKEFSQEAGELTPTLKFKRRFIMEKYKDVIDELYAKKPERTNSSL